MKAKRGREPKYKVAVIASSLGRPPLARKVWSMTRGQYIEEIALQKINGFLELFYKDN